MQIKVHKSITPDRIVRAVKDSWSSLDNPGFCIACGADADGCEPDAENYICAECDKAQVYGAERLLGFI